MATKKSKKILKTNNKQKTKSKSKQKEKPKAKTAAKKSLKKEKMAKQKKTAKVQKSQKQKSQKKLKKEIKKTNFKKTSKNKIINQMSKSSKSGAKNQSLVKKEESDLNLLSPLDDRLLVEIGTESNVTPGGIIIPDTVKEKPQSGRVVAVGRGHRNIKGRIRPMDVKVGDKILFPRFSGDEIEIKGKKFLIMREADILGIT